MRLCKMKYYNNEKKETENQTLEIVNMLPRWWRLKAGAAVKMRVQWKNLLRGASDDFQMKTS